MAIFGGPAPDPRPDSGAALAPPSWDEAQDSPSVLGTKRGGRTHETGPSGDSAPAPVVAVTRRRLSSLTGPVFAAATSTARTEFATPGASAPGCAGVFHRLSVVEKWKRFEKRELGPCG